MEKYLSVLLSSLKDNNYLFISRIFFRYAHSHITGSIATTRTAYVHARSVTEKACRIPPMIMRECTLRDQLLTNKIMTE